MIVYGNAVLGIIIATYFFLVPFCLLLNDLADPNLSNPNMPKVAYRWHRQLTDDFQYWAQSRVASQAAKGLDVDDISGTEWPMFSAVFYLWSTEALQADWQQSRSEQSSVLVNTSPKEYAKQAIKAAVELVVDPNNATWVIEHWGDDYLHQENVFYRMLFIAGLNSYQQLSGDKQYVDLLRDQVTSLANELNASPHGLLDDYPGQCYPVDIVPAIAVIRRADDLLGTNNAMFVERSQRGFIAAALDHNTQLPAYYADAITGQGLGPARGVGISYMLIWAAELWPELANDWYDKYATQFWQKGTWLSGFREFAKGSKYPEWGIDVDAGPIVGGYGTAANAFGLAAARTHGHFDHAHILSALALVSSWPLLDGTLLVPRLLSNLSDAPYVGEAAMLFSFTRPTLSIKNEYKLGTEYKLPLAVYLVLLLYLIIGLFGLWLALNRIKSYAASLPQQKYGHFSPQLIIWLCLVGGSVTAWLVGLYSVSLILILLASLMPRGFKS